MLDIGWTELLVIAVILIVVVGPKDLPPMIRAFGKMTKRLRQTAGEFRAQFDEALREAELDDLKNSVNDLRSLNPANTIRETLNPLRQMGQEIKSDLERTTRPDSKPASTGDDFEQNSILPDLPFGLDEPPQELKPQAPASAQPAPAPQAVSAPGPAVAVPASAPAVPEATTSAPVTSAPAAPAPAKARKAATQKPSAKTEAPAKNPIKPAKAAPVAKTVAAPTKTAAAASKAKPSKSAATKAPSVQTPSTATKAPAKPRKTKSEDRA